MKGMEYKDRSGDPDLLEALINDPEWVFQQKMDGTRVLIDLETLQFSQRNGNPLKHTAATQWIPAILEDLADIGLSGQANTILDCELLIERGELWVFDVIDPWNLDRPMIDRAVELAQLPTGERVRIVPTSMTIEGKRELVEACRDREGVVAKLRSGPYVPGKRVEHVVKLKNVHRAEVVVMSTSLSPLSASLGVWTEDGPRTISRASLIGKDPMIAPGDVVEVEYLAWTGASLLQPRIVRRRPDKTAEDCILGQFMTYSREAI